MRIFNPNYVPPIDATANSIKAKLATWFAAHPNVQSVTLDQVVAAAPEAAGMLQGSVHQIAKDAGWLVDTNG